MLIIALGFALRLYALASESLWYDELLQLDIAQDSLGSMLAQLPKHSAVPLDYLISHIWIILGRSEAWVRWPAVFVGTVTLPLAYQLGRSLLDEQTALILLGLLAVSPFHIHYSQEVRPYALIVLGVVLAGYGFWQMCRTGRWRYAIALLGGILIFSLAHFFALVIFIPWLAFAVIDFITTRQRQRTLQTGGVLIAAGAIALAVILLLGWGRTIWNVTWWGFGQAVIEPERFTRAAEEKPNFGSGPRLDEIFFENQVFAPLGANLGSGSTLRLFNGLAILGLAYLLIQKRYRASLLLGLWFILPIAAILAFLVQRGAFYEPRYIISTLPVYLMLVAMGILALPRWLKCAEPRWLSVGALLLIGVLVLLSSTLSLHDYYTDQEKEDWRLVAQFLERNAGPDDAVIAVNAESTLNWYYPPATATPDQFDTLEAVQARVAEAERAWVVVSIFTEYIGISQKLRVWLGEQDAVKLALDPLIDVYYVGPTATPPQLLAEVRNFALPPNHQLYAELARQNRREPTIARQYYQMAFDHAPTADLRAEYQAEMDSLPGK